MATTPQQTSCAGAASDSEAVPRPQAGKQTSKKTSAQQARWAKNWDKAPPKPTTIRRIGGDLYWVSSASHPGTGHHVTPQSCTCPAGKFGRMCRHRKIIAAYHAWRLHEMRRHAGGRDPVSGMAALQEAFE